MARQRGIRGWHAMRKDQLVRALVSEAKQKSKTNGSSHGNGHRKKGATVSPAAAKSAPASRKTTAKAKVVTRTRPVAKPKNVRIQRRMEKARSDQEQRKDLSLMAADSKRRSNGKRVEKDRVVLLVRDAYWIHAYWELTRLSVERARAALAAHWHSAQPMLRLCEVERGGTTKTSECVIRKIEIHSGVNNWYIDLHDPPGSYRVEIGFQSSNNKFHVIARSNVVTTPPPGSSDEVDQNWSDIAENCEKIYSQSGGDEATSEDLRELFEERLRRPMGSPMVTRYGNGAEGLLNLERDFEFDVESELIVFGTTKPNAYVTLRGDPVKVRPDGSFTVRVRLVDRRQVIPVVAVSSDGLEQRTTVIAVERNTKSMEPLIREPDE